MDKILRVLVVSLALFSFTSVGMEPPVAPREDTRIILRPLYLHEMPARVAEYFRRDKETDEFYRTVSEKSDALSKFYSENKNKSDVDWSSQDERNEQISRMWREYDERKASNKEFVKQFAQLACHEIRRTSRLPHDSEIAASEKMQRLLRERGIPVDEVRFMDADSRIQAMGLDPSAKLMLRCLLCAPDISIDWLVERFISDSHFSNSALRKKIRNDLLIGTRSSTTYRNLFIAAYAWSLANPSLCDQLIYQESVIGDRKFDFSESAGPACLYNSIETNYDNMGFCRSLIASCFGIFLGDGFSSYKVDSGHALFHEIGHTVFGLPAMISEITEIDAGTMKAVSELFKFEVSRDDFIATVKHYREMSPAEQEELRFSLLDVFLEREISDIDGCIKIMKEAIASKEKMARILLSDIVEVLQIHGVSIVRDGDKNVLIVNKYSEIGLFAELGLPIRHVHQGFWGGEYKFVSYPPVPGHFSRDDEMHSALFALYGVDMEDYLSRVHSNLMLNADNLLRQKEVFRFHTIESPLFRGITFPIHIHPEMMRMLTEKSEEVVLRRSFPWDQ